MFRTAAETGRVPGLDDVAEALKQPEDVVADSFGRLADGRAVILAPWGSNIWAADPFCAVPSAFRVTALGRTYWDICIWDALGIPAALSADGAVTAQCGDCCGEELVLEVRGGASEYFLGLDMTGASPSPRTAPGLGASKKPRVLHFCS